MEKKVLQRVRYFDLVSIKLVVYLAVLFVWIAIASAAECPSYTKVLTCTPKCKHDSECSAIGGKCCPNICNERSCARPNELSKYGSGNRDIPFGSKDSPWSSKTSAVGSGGPGVFCGNVKCGPFEKCIMDRTTKRQRCVRS